MFQHWGSRRKARRHFGKDWLEGNRKRENSEYQMQSKLSEMKQDLPLFYSCSQTVCQARGDWREKMECKEMMSRIAVGHGKGLEGGELQQVRGGLNRRHIIDFQPNIIF